MSQNTGKRSLSGGGAAPSKAGTAVVGPLRILIRFWSVRLPRLLDPWAPSWADSTADGMWTASLRGVAAIAPLAALVLGYLAIRIWPDADVFSASLPFMAVFIVGATLSGPVGVMLLLGYVIGDVTSLRGLDRVQYLFSDSTPLEQFLRWAAGHLVSFLLLAILAQRLPQLARRMAGELVLRFRITRLGVWTVLYAATSGLLVYLWAQAVVVLIRPRFTWLGDSPAYDDIHPVQGDWPWLVGAAVVAAAVRLTLEVGSARRMPSGGVRAELWALRTAEPVRRGAGWRRVPALVPAVLAAGLAALLLGGMYQSWLDALAVGIVFVALNAWSAGLLGGIPKAWTRAAQRVPALVRVGVVVGVGYVVSNLALGLWVTDSFRPVLLGSLLTVSLFYLLFPRPVISRGRQSPVGGTAALGWLIGLTLVACSLIPTAVFADNCAGDNRLDCWLSGGAAAWGAVSAAAAGAFGWVFGKGGGAEADSSHSDAGAGITGGDMAEHVGIHAGSEVADEAPEIAGALTGVEGSPSVPIMGTGVAVLQGGAAFIEGARAINRSGSLFGGPTQSGQAMRDFVNEKSDN